MIVWTIWMLNYYGRFGFILVLPRLADGIGITRRDLIHMGNGGFCLGCSECHYPDCGFGKGV